MAPSEKKDKATKQEKPSLLSRLSHAQKVFIVIASIGTVFSIGGTTIYRFGQVEKTVEEHVANKSVHITEEHLKNAVNEAVQPMSNKLSSVDTELRLRGEQMNRIEDMVRDINRRTIRQTSGNEKPTGMARTYDRLSDQNPN